MKAGQKLRSDWVRKFHRKEGQEDEEDIDRRIDQTKWGFSWEGDFITGSWEQWNFPGYK